MFSLMCMTDQAVFDSLVILPTNYIAVPFSYRDPLDNPVNVAELDPLDHRETVEQMEPPDLRDHQDPPDPLEPQECPESPELR